MSRTSQLRLSPHQYDDARARRQIHVPESDVLAACLELLARHPRVAFARRCNTGSGYLIYAHRFNELVVAGAMKRNEARFMRFGVKGAADITGMLRGGRRLEVECKSDTGRLEDEQLQFLDAINGGGGLGIVARSVDELVEALA